MDMTVCGAAACRPGVCMMVVPGGRTVGAMGSGACDGMVVGGASRLVEGDKDIIVVVGAGSVWVGGGSARIFSFFGGLRRINEE